MNTSYFKEILDDFDNVCDKRHISVQLSCR